MTLRIPESAPSSQHEPMNDSIAACLLCARDSDVVPLISLQYRRATFHVCPQHLPVLIHDPAQLIGRLAGAEAFRPSDIHD